MSIEDAWKLYLEPGGKSVENRNRIVSLLYGPLVDRLVEHLNEKYVDAIASEAGYVLVEEIENTTNPLSIADLANVVRRKNYRNIDFKPSGGALIGLAERGDIDVVDHYSTREREEWKVSEDRSVDDPTIRFRPFSASLIAAEECFEAARAEKFLVRKSTE